MLPPAAATRAAQCVYFRVLFAHGRVWVLRGVADGVRGLQGQHRCFDRSLIAERLSSIHSAAVHSGCFMAFAARWPPNVTMVMREVK